MTRSIDRIGPVSGLFSPIVALGSILLATILSPTFSWRHSALSDLGVAGGVVSLLFNGGLVLGGLLAVPFGVWLFVRAQNRLEQCGVVSFWLTAVAMAGVGLFPAGTPLHAPAAIGFYLLLSCSLWLYGLGTLVAGDRRTGTATIALGIVNLGSWIVWATSLRESIPGLAIPEIVGALALSVWVLGTVVRG